MENNLPEHIAIIMDGNRRWAKEKNLEVKQGHYAGAENLKKIAEPFFTTKEYGTGLGVGLSMEIVKKHQGTMKYYSKEGNGTTVELVFPLLESL